MKKALKMVAEVIGVIFMGVLIFFALFGSLFSLGVLAGAFFKGILAVIR